MAQEYKNEWNVDIVLQMKTKGKKNIIEYINELGIIERYEHILNRIKIFNRIGETITNKYGSNMTIIEYYNARNIIVEFDNGFTVKTSYKNFKTGGIKSPYCKSVQSTGYIGEGKYQPSNENGEKTKAYACWNSMFQRCYNINQQKTSPAYIDCYICEEWHNFQNFAKWFHDNYYNIKEERIDLDKDILVKGNKIYSPETCVFVPQTINALFTKSDKTRGEFPIGVSLSKNKYLAYCNIRQNNKNKMIRIGLYDTPEDAFHNGYKPFKENYIKQIADRYKDQIPKRVHDSMYNWIVEITD